VSPFRRYHLANVHLNLFLGKNVFGEAESASEGLMAV
jgi:hypothetical protein